MENMCFLFAAYTIIWAVVFGYVFYLYRKQRKLQQEINLLKEIMNKQK
ncbi:MAG: CcmD family protein [Chloroflexota bacterium]|nr:CcmD family protein [Chloroflexota bacterium]